MKIGICDDNMAERNYLASCCKELGYNNIDLYISGEDYLKRNVSPDILFLDIELKDVSGLMLDTFGRNVIGFIHKPASTRQVQQYLQKVSYYHNEFSEIILEDKKGSIPCSDIICIEADGVYTLLHTSDNIVHSSR